MFPWSDIRENHPPSDPLMYSRMRVASPVTICVSISQKTVVSPKLVMSLNERTEDGLAADMMELR